MLLVARCTSQLHVARCVLRVASACSLVVKSRCTRSSVTPRSAGEHSPAGKARQGSADGGNGPHSHHAAHSGQRAACKMQPATCNTPPATPSGTLRPVGDNAQRPTHAAQPRLRSGGRMWRSTAPTTAASSRPCRRTPARREACRAQHGPGATTRPGGRRLAITRHSRLRRERGRAWQGAGSARALTGAAVGWMGGEARGARRAGSRSTRARRR
jgi:hypothetical protein